MYRAPEKFQPRRLSLLVGEVQLFLNFHRNCIAQDLFLNHSALGTGEKCMKATTGYDNGIIPLYCPATTETKKVTVSVLFLEN